MEARSSITAWYLSRNNPCFEVTFLHSVLVQKQVLEATLFQLEIQMPLLGPAQEKNAKDAVYLLIPGTGTSHPSGQMPVFLARNLHQLYIWVNGQFLSNCVINNMSVY